MAKYKQMNNATSRMKIRSHYPLEVSKNTQDMISENAL